MAKWGSAKWGTFKWGTGAAGPQPTATGDYLWTLAVDWGAGWVNEAGRCVGLRPSTRGRKFYVAQGADTFEHCQPGVFTFELDNKDRRFDPYNTSSPLYGSIEPGKPVWLRVKYSGVSYPVFRGTISDIRPISGSNRVQMICADYLQWLADQDVSVTLTSNDQSLTVSDAIAAVLEAAHYPYPVNIAHSNCPITYFSVEAQNALDTIRELCDAGVGTAFCDADGIFRYLDLSSSGLTNHTLTQDKLLKEIAVSQPWENVRNKITCVANRYGYSPLQEVWRSDEPIYVAANGTTTLKIEFDECAVIQPVKMIDYMDDARPIVSGGVISWGHYFDASLSNITSTTANLNIHNSDPASAQWLAWIAVRGNKLVNKKISFSKTDDTSAAKGPKRFKIDSPWLQDRGFAAAYVDLLLAFLKDPCKNPIVQLETRGDGLSIDLFHTVTLTIAALGIDETFDVGGIDWEWLADTGQGFRQTVYLQKVLYSSTVITPQPFKPGLPAVPVNPGPGGPGGTTTNPGEGGPTYQQTMTCLDDLVAQGSNGPYSTGQNTVISNEAGAAAYNAGLWFRTRYNPNRTYVTIDGVWETFAGGVWVPDASWDFAAVEAYDVYNREVFVGGLAAQGAVADGVRFYLFDNTLKYYVKHIAFRFDALGGSDKYTKTSTTAAFTGTLAGNSSAGITATGLTPNNWYCAEFSGDYLYQADAWAYATLVHMDFGAGWEGSWGTFNNPNGAHAPASGFPQTGHVPYLELIDANHARLFFLHTGTLKARCAEINTGVSYADNSGSMTVTIFPAAAPGTTRRCRVRSVNFYNVCQGQPDSSPK